MSKKGTRVSKRCSQRGTRVTREKQHLAASCKVLEAVDTDMANSSLGMIINRVSTKVWQSCTYQNIGS
jgi:hypothetical protein